MKVCSIPGCPTLVDSGRCATHNTQARKARVDNRAYSSKAHLTFRDAVLKRDPTCVLCHNAPSHVADHYPRTRRELVAHHMNPNDPKHGRGLCDDCHNKHTARTSPGGWADR